MLEENADNRRLIRELSEILFAEHRENTLRLPARAEITAFADSLLGILFAGYFNRQVYQHAYEIESELVILAERLKNILAPFITLCRIKTEVNIEETVHAFFSELPDLYRLLQTDAMAMYEGDPAAESLNEVILAYPGFLCIAIHRIAHIFYNAQVPVFPRMLSEYAHERTGIDIHPGAKIGQAFFLDHGTGIVIGETCVIGHHVKIYQGVTLGALSVEKHLANKKRHPTIEDNVVIYAGATILGGETTIGHDSIIGGNVWLTESVLPFSVLYYKSDVQMRTSKKLNTVIDFSI